MQKYNAFDNESMRILNVELSKILPSTAHSPPHGCMMPKKSYWARYAGPMLTGDRFDSKCSK